MLAAGLLVAVVASATAPSNDPEGDEIIVSEPAVRTMVEQFSRTWNRMPNESELDNLISGYVREEALVREAQRLGLDQGDQIVRRRLASKMEAILVAEGEAAEPSDADIEAYFDKNWKRYAAPQNVSFDQIYLGEVSGNAAKARAQHVLAQLNSGANWQTLGEPILIDRSYNKAPAEVVSREIGGEFADKLASAPQNKWIGPVNSAYGAHLVRVQSASGQQRPELASVRDQVVADWREANAKASVAKASDELMSRYTVTIEQP